MTTKLNIKNIVSKMKEGIKAAKPVADIKKPVIPAKTHRERDMRQEAIDMGSHQAKEFFGNSKT